MPYYLFEIQDSNVKFIQEDQPDQFNEIKDIMAYKNANGTDSLLVRSATRSDAESLAQAYVRR